MMITRYNDFEGKDVSKDVAVNYHELVNNGTIDIAKLTILFASIAQCQEQEAIDAFNSAMYQFALYMQCDGNVRFTSNRYSTIATANNELIAMLKSEDKSNDSVTSNTSKEVFRHEVD